MPIAVRVVSQAQFDEWIAAMKTRATRGKAKELLERIAIEHAKVAAAPAAARMAATPAR